MTENKRQLFIGVNEESFQSDKINRVIQNLKAQFEITFFQDDNRRIRRGKAKTYEQDNPADVFLFLPLTGEELSKLANGLMDTTKLKTASDVMAQNRPVVIAIFTEDALNLNGNNLMKLMVTKNIYFVPFYQDDLINHPNRLVADFDRVFDTILYALKGKQIQPIIIAREKGD